MKDLTWLLFYVPPDFEFQLGHRSIDDDDEELGEYGDQGLKLRAVDGRKSN